MREAGVWWVQLVQIPAFKSSSGSQMLGKRPALPLVAPVSRHTEGRTNLC